ncbi:ribosomal protein S5 domain 2-type protein [Powellomyces hirtus]|nr:ribosomal protein S5 domain 2-type protein [Powellomyces hirtus]
MTETAETENKALQEEEIVALSAIYGPDFQRSTESPDTITITLHLPPGPAVLHCHRPTSYPSLELPYYELITEWTNRAGIRYGVSDPIRKAVETTFMESFVPGEVVIFEWIEALKLILETKYGVDGDADEDAIEKMSEESKQRASVRASPHVTTEVSELEDEDEPAGNFPMTLPPHCPPITHSSEPLVERKSVFVAHVAPIKSASDVSLVLSALLSNKRIRRATHNIMAYRLVEENGVVKQDCDDDGETAAGGRLLHMLNLANVNGAVVVVTRWYGGVHLGPARFKHINNVGRKLLESCGYIPAAGESKKGGKKR